MEVIAAVLDHRPALKDAVADVALFSPTESLLTDLLLLPA